MDCLYKKKVYTMKQKQSSIGVLMKRGSENVRQIYSRKPMSKCDFNKFAKQIVLLHGCFPVNLLHIFQNTFLQKHLWRTASDEKHYKRRYSHTICFFFIEIYDCMHLFVFFNMKSRIKNISSYHLFYVFTVWSEQ